MWEYDGRPVGGPCHEGLWCWWWNVRGNLPLRTDEEGVVCWCHNVSVSAGGRPPIMRGCSCLVGGGSLDRWCAANGGMWQRGLS